MATWLARWKPSTDSLAKIQAAAKARLGSGAGQGRQHEPRGADAIKSAAVDAPILEDVKAIPSGTYLSFVDVDVPEGFAESFACLSTEEGSAIVLVAPEAWCTHPQYDLLRRLQRAGVTNLSAVRASREIIKTIHSTNAKVSGRDSENRTEIESIAREMIDEAVKVGASDIHIETRSTHAQVLFRIFGVRFEQPSVSMETAIAMCNVLYGVHADEKNKQVYWNPDTIQDTSIDHKTADGKVVQIRFNSAPIHPAGNFQATMRVLVQEASARSLKDMGHSPEMTEDIEDMLVGAQGMVVYVGPTNSAKSTVMQACVNRLYAHRGPNIKVITIEAPVEYLIPRACQTSVRQVKKGYDEMADVAAYTESITATFRQDPDVLMIGEVRDHASAKGVKDLVLGGRKLLTTLHAYDPFAIFARLRELGVPRDVLYGPGFISGVVYQRLVRQLCPKCAIPIGQAYEEGKVRHATFLRVHDVANLQVHKVMARGEGCEVCMDSGIVGRALCASVLVPDFEMLAMLSNGDDFGARRHWLTSMRARNEGLGGTAVAHAITKMRQGLLDPSDIESEIGLLVIDVPDEGASAPAARVTPLRPRPPGTMPASLR